MCAVTNLSSPKNDTFRGALDRAGTEGKRWKGTKFGVLESLWEVGGGPLSQLPYAIILRAL